MYFPQNSTAEKILTFIKPKLEAVLDGANNGVDIDIKKHVKNRSLEQNNYLWGIYANIVKFFETTGFVPDGLQVKFINSDFLHAYFKARFDVKTTTKMTTAEFAQYTDKIQNLMLEQSKGEYEPIYPETTEQYFERTIS
jgi:hypothetical protein